MEGTQKLIDVAYNAAVRAAVEASHVMMPFWPNPLNHQFDGRRALELTQKEEGIGNIATKADTLSEAKIIEVIRADPQLRAHSISAEEAGDINGNQQWRWSIDPIDGSLNFLNGIPDFGICIALFNGDRVVVGVIAMPALQQLVAVQEGGNAKLFAYSGDEIADLSLLAKRHDDRLDNALVGYNLGYVNRDRQLMEIAERLVTKVGYPSSLGSFATGNFRLLQGMVGAYFGMSPTVMDVAPAAALIPAIGGVISDMEGKPIDWSAPKRTYLGAVNKRIHEQFLAAMAPTQHQMPLP